MPCHLTLLLSLLWPSVRDPIGIWLVTDEKNRHLSALLQTGSSSRICLRLTSLWLCLPNRDYHSLAYIYSFKPPRSFLNLILFLFLHYCNMAPPHPLSILSLQETERARQAVLALHSNTVVDFREIYFQEPPKAELTKYLDLEHSGQLTPSSPRPTRLAKCQYDVIGSDKIPEYHESWIDVESGKCTKHELIGKQHHASLTL